MQRCSRFGWLVLLSLGTLGAASETITLVGGQQKVLSVPGVTRIAIADPNVADVKVINENEVLVTAMGSGQTELTVWRGSRVTTYDMRVTNVDPKQLKREVEKVLDNRDGIRVRIVRDSVVIDGTVMTLQDLEKAEEAAQLFPQVRNYVKLDPSAHSQVAEAISQQLTSAGLMHARATVVGATIFLEGIVDTEADLRKAEIVARAIGRNVQSTVRIGSSRMVELDVEFVEISKRSLDRIGIRWPTELSGNVSVNFAKTVVLGKNQTRPDSETFQGQAVLEGSLGLALQFNDGVTRTLARPRLVTTSQQEAKFLAGGEIPIPLMTEERVHIEYKEYGVRLRITPVVEAGDTIQTKVLAEISDVDPSVSVQGVPGFTSRRVETQVTVRNGETIVLSGLLHLGEGKDVSKVPIVGHVPIIGELFKSRQFQERLTELAVFVTPRIVDPTSQRIRELSTHMLRRYEEAEDEVGFSMFD